MFPDVSHVICYGTKLVPNQQLLEQSPSCHTGPVLHCVVGEEGERGPAAVPFPRWWTVSRLACKRLHNPQRGEQDGTCVSHWGVILLGQPPPKHSHSGMWLAAQTQLECREDLPVLSAK